MESKYQLYCCGSRGSRPVEGIKFNEFGGFTTCYVLKTDDYALIIDCGTGLYEANPIILDCSVVDVVLTHMHYDHVLGMLDWDTLNQKSKITFYGGFDKWYGDKTFDEFFKAPFWPVQPSFVLKQSPKQGERLVLRNDLYVEFFPSPHPNETQRMIIHYVDGDKDNKIAVMFDNENSNGIDIELVSNCDYLLYDGMYTDSEYAKKQGYGHSTWQEAVRFATRVNPKRLIVTHHSPFRTDDELRNFENKSRELFPATDFARSGQHWDFPNTDAIKSETQTTNKKKTKLKIGEFIDDIVLDNTKFSHFLSLGMNIILGTVSVFMSIVNLFTNKTLLMYSTILFAVCCFVNAILEYRFKKLHDVLLLVFQIEMIALFVFFIISGTPEGFSVIWTLLLPVAGVLVFGQKRTLILSIIMELILVFSFETPLGRNYLQYNYTDSFMLRLPMAFLAFTCMGMFLGYIRERLSKALNDIREEQAKTIANQTAELRAQYFDIVRANSKLQLRNKILQGMIGEDVSDDKIREMLPKEDER